MTINPDELEMNNKPHKEEVTERELRMINRWRYAELDKEVYNG